MNAQEYVRKVKNLPSISDVSIKVNELLDDPTSTANNFDDVISKDPALTAKLLKLVNSAFYGLSYKVETISRAVSIVGFKQIRELVSSIAVIDAFKNLDSETLTLRQFWEHSLGCSVSARVLAIYKRITNPEIYFTAGLLHDIGKLILLSYSPDEYTEVVRLIEANGRMGYECEKEVFGFTHGEVGAELCRQWNHPESLLEAVAYHHEPVKLAEHSDLTAVTHVADIITHACQFGNSGDPFVPVLDPSAWDAIGLSTGILKPTVEKVHEQIEEITDALLSDQF